MSSRWSVRDSLLVCVFAVLVGCGPRPPAPTPPPPPGGDPGSGLTAAQNGRRAAAGVPPLKDHPALVATARAWAAELARTNPVDKHGDWLGRIRRAGFTGAAVSENVAWGPFSAEDCVAAWMSDLPHRRNVIDPRWRYTGGAAARDAAGRWYYVADYGSD